MVIWAGISHATKHAVDLNQCLPRAMSAQGMSFPPAKAIRALPQCRSLVEELRVPQALCCTDAVPAFSCYSFVLVRTNLSTDYSHDCKLSLADRGRSGLLWISLHSITIYIREVITTSGTQKIQAVLDLKLPVNPFIQLSCIHYSSFLVCLTLVFN